jgi:Enoyl-(Acyl carrier protein) reductase
LLGRTAQPEEIADLVVFLASGQAGYLTATTVLLDGGIMQGASGYDRTVAPRPSKTSEAQSSDPGRGASSIASGAQ